MEFLCVKKNFHHCIWIQHHKSPTRDCFHPDSIMFIMFDVLPGSHMTNVGRVAILCFWGRVWHQHSGIPTWLYFCLILINLCWNSQLGNFLSKTSRFSRKLRNGQWKSGHIEFLLAFLKSAPLVYPKTVVITANCCFLFLY